MSLEALGGVSDTRYEYLLLELYVCWRCLLTLSTKVQVHFGRSEATLHHQGLAVYSVLSGTCCRDS